jgi:hypothetical protein
MRRSKDETPNNKIVELKPLRDARNEEKRRKFERILFKNMLGCFSVVEGKYLKSVELIDVSKEGLSFQLPHSSKTALDFEINKDFIFRFYFNENSYLAKRALKPLEENLGSNNIFTMRCVLPHLKNPFAFLEDIFFSDSQAIVYIEYQNLEWIIREQMWQQISHDHVNYFSIESFDCHFNVISRGVFGNGEWSFVLIDGKNTSNKTNLPSNLEKLIELEDSIPRILEEKIQRVRAPLGIYGAAGKGTLFAYELKKLGIVDVVAYDEESLFWNKFLEASGVQVQNPIEIAKLDSLTDLIVMNPNHYDHALSRYGAFTSIHK